MFSRLRKSLRAHFPISRGLKGDGAKEIKSRRQSLRRQLHATDPTNLHAERPAAYYAQKIKEQGRIHGYLSRVRLDRGSDKSGLQSIWVGAVMQKPPANTE